MANPHYGFSRLSRLPRPPEFRAVLKGGSKSRDKFFSVFAASNSRRRGRIGLTVSRRISPNATRRNWVKRQIRESYRHHQNELAGLDVVVVAHVYTREADGHHLQTSLRQHWKKILLQCKKP